MSDDSINKLQALLKELFDKDYSVEQAKAVGVAVMRFVLAKRQRQLDKIQEYKEDIETQQWLN